MSKAWNSCLTAAVWWLLSFASLITAGAQTLCPTKLSITYRDVLGPEDAICTTMREQLDLTTSSYTLQCASDAAVVIDRTVFDPVARATDVSGEIWAQDACSMLFDALAGAATLWCVVIARATQPAPC